MEEPDSLTLGGLAAPWQHRHELSGLHALCFVCKRQWKVDLNGYPEMIHSNQSVSTAGGVFLLGIPLILALVLFDDLCFVNL